MKLKGANRHENWPDTGHYVSEERMARDLELLKQGNANHVRTCHYADAPRWYELCDEYGIYLVAEANIESHGYGYGKDSLSNQPEWEKAHVARNVANVETHKNHPSVVIWSLGNEAGPGPNFRAALRAVKALDPTRPTHYERFGVDDDNPCDLDSVMYPSPDWLASIGQSQRKKPFYCCEYAHAMSNSMGALGEYNDIFDQYENLMGGAIWEWQDQALWNRRDPQHPFLAYGGDFGDQPNDSVFILKGVVFADRTPTPKYPEMKRAYQWIAFTPADPAVREVQVRNKYAFLNLNKFKPVWKLTSDGRLLKQGELPNLDVPPGQTSALTGPWTNPALERPGTETFLHVGFVLDRDERWARRGYEVAGAQFALPSPALAAASQPAADQGTIQVEQDADQVRVSVRSPLAAMEPNGKPGESVQESRLVLDRHSGLLREWTVNGVPLLRPGGGPSFYAWRAPHLNDNLWAAGAWKSRGLDQLKFKPLAIEVTNVSRTATQVRVSGTSEGKHGFALNTTTTYTIHPDGSLALDLSLAPGAPRIVLARAGVRLFLEPSLTNVTYFGRGPLENYPDRKRGAEVGRWSTTTDRLMTPYSPPWNAATTRTCAGWRWPAGKARACWPRPTAGHCPCRRCPTPTKNWRRSNTPTNCPPPARRCSASPPAPLGSGPPAAAPNR